MDDNGRQQLFRVHALTGDSKPLYDTETITAAFQMVEGMDGDTVKVGVCICVCLCPGSVQYII